MYALLLLRNSTITSSAVWAAISGKRLKTEFLLFHLNASFPSSTCHQRTHAALTRHEQECFSSSGTSRPKLSLYFSELHQYKNWRENKENKTWNLVLSSNTNTCLSNTLIYDQTPEKLMTFQFHLSLCYSKCLLANVSMITT